MKHLLLTLCVTLAFLELNAQAENTFLTDFQTFYKANDTAGQRKVLEEWQASNPEDPELYTSYFNYYIVISRREEVVISTDPVSGEGYELRDSSGELAGFLGTTIVYDSALFEKGLAIINEGIRKYPDRLDMRFGKIYVLKLNNDWTGFTDELIATIKYSGVNNNRWLWTGNEPKEDAREFLLSALQTYQLDLYNTMDDALLVNMRKIAEATLILYPDHIESLTNISITYIILHDYDNGIRYLKKAEALDSTDYIVLSNLAHAYKLKGDFTTSIEYYRKVVQYGNPGAQEYARSQIREMEQK